MEDLNTTGRMHKIIMTNRRTCTVNGVNDVLSLPGMVRGELGVGHEWAVCVSHAINPPYKKVFSLEQF